MTERPNQESEASAASQADREPSIDALDQGSLETQFQRLMAALTAAREANDAQRCLLLDLRTHQIELEIQGRMLRETQLALEVSRNHYARLFDEAPVGYVVFDRAGVIRAVNLTAATLLGCPRSELEGVSFLPFVVDAQLDTFQNYLLAVFEETASCPVPCDLVLHLRESSRIRVVRLCSIRRENPDEPESLTVLLDITAEYDAERHRQASDRLRQSVLDALPSQIAVLDRNANIIAVNRAWRDYADDSGVSQALRDAIGSDRRPVRAEARALVSVEDAFSSQDIQGVIKRQRPGFSVEYPCHKPHKKCWFLMRTVPLEGEQEGAVVAYLDITERRLAEEEARKARDALAQVARLNAVGILASSLIHELLQPLSSANFFCSAAAQLADGPAADPARLVDVISRINEQIQRAGDIMERLRVFLRGRTMHKVSVPLDQVVKRAFALVQWFALDHKTELRLIAPAELPEVFTDPVQIEQILVNLICNAVQAIDEAGCERREVVVEVTPGEQVIEMIVRDSGPGLPPGRHEALFDIFESTNDSNLGLGLAISRAIAEAHGGRLWAEPAPAEGAVFHLTIPFSTPATPPSASAPAA